MTGSQAIKAANLGFADDTGRKVSDVCLFSSELQFFGNNTNT